MKSILTILVMGMLLITTACSPLERDAYNAIVGAKAFLDTIRSNHPECIKGQLAPGICGDITRAVAAKDTLIDAAEIYCASADFDATGAQCAPPAKGTPARDQAEAKLRAALTSYDMLAGDLKVALKGAK